jgi:hypothetical protein
MFDALSLGVQKTGNSAFETYTVNTYKERNLVLRTMEKKWKFNYKIFGILLQALLRNVRWPCSWYICCLVLC